MQICTIIHKMVVFQCLNSTTLIIQGKLPTKLHFNTLYLTILTIIFVARSAALKQTRNCPFFWRPHDNGDLTLWRLELPFNYNLNSWNHNFLWNFWQFYKVNQKLSNLASYLTKLWHNIKPMCSSFTVNCTGNIVQSPFFYASHSIFY